MKKILLGFIVIGLISCSDTKKDKYVEQAEKESSAIKAWAEKKTVKKDNSEIQKLKIGDKAHGGIVAHIDSTGKHGIVCSLEDLPAEKSIEYCSFKGYIDWRLPTPIELEFYLCANLHKKGLGSFEVDEAYESSSRTQYGDAFGTVVFSFSNKNCNGDGELYPNEWDRKIYTRPVRDF